MSYFSRRRCLRQKRAPGKLEAWLKEIIFLVTLRGEPAWRNLSVTEPEGKGCNILLIVVFVVVVVVVVVVQSHG